MYAVSMRVGQASGAGNWHKVGNLSWIGNILILLWSSLTISRCTSLCDYFWNKLLGNWITHRMVAISVFTGPHWRMVGNVLRVVYRLFCNANSVANTITATRTEDRLIQRVTEFGDTALISNHTRDNEIYRERHNIRFASFQWLRPVCQGT